MMVVSTINHTSCVNLLTKVMHVTFTPLRLFTAATISCFIGTWSLSAIAAEPMTLKIDITRPTRGLIEASIRPRVGRVISIFRVIGSAAIADSDHVPIKQEMVAAVNSRKGVNVTCITLVNKFTQLV